MNKEKVRITFTVSKELKEKLEREANMRELSLSSYLRQVLKQTNESAQSAERK